MPGSEENVETEGTACQVPRELLKSEDTACQVPREMLKTDGSASFEGPDGCKCTGTKF